RAFRSGRKNKKGAARATPFSDLACAVRLERTLHRFHAETFDDVACTDVFVVLEGHTAFLADLDFLDFVLEALERLELAFVDDDVVAQEAHAGTTFDHAFGDLTAGNLADLGDLEDFL